MAGSRVFPQCTPAAASTELGGATSEAINLALTAKTDDVEWHQSGSALP